MEFNFLITRRQYRKCLEILSVVILFNFLFSLMLHNQGYTISTKPYENKTHITNDSSFHPSDPSTQPEWKECFGGDGITEECKSSAKWLLHNWKVDPCYLTFGVNGSACSIRTYLSEVDEVCPLMTNRTREVKKPQKLPQTQTARLNYDLSSLLEKMQAQQIKDKEKDNYVWMKTRIQRLWPSWVEGAKTLQSQNKIHDVPQKRVLIHLGLLASDEKMHFAENAFKGGPLGELVQWSDIVAALYILGHDIQITSEIKELNTFITSNALRCHQSDLSFDLIYSDIHGVKHLKSLAPRLMSKRSCILRVIDSFGTEPSFNYEPYALSHNMNTTWGRLGLKPQQFNTMFPHSPDNTFMGFVVALPKPNGEAPVRLNQALVYGKRPNMWKGKQSTLDVIHKHLSIHGTVYSAGRKDLPSYVQNHGLLNGSALIKLQQESKIFLGLGFPYEGPAPLEAIAQGCIFINAKFDPPQNSKNTKFFEGKPTLRKLTSQHPYAEDFIGEPHVFTVNINDTKKLEATIVRALEQFDTGKVLPYLPYEYTEQGMLQRLHLQILHQDFCKDTTTWPPQAAIQVLMGRAGQSCHDVCREKDLLCEPSPFYHLNSVPVMNKYLPKDKNCTHSINKEDIYMPAYHARTGHCLLQEQKLLYSCVGAHETMERLCPCRDYVPGQTALCTACV